MPSVEAEEKGTVTFIQAIKGPVQDGMCDRIIKDGWMGVVDERNFLF